MLIFWESWKQNKKSAWWNCGGFKIHKIKPQRQRDLRLFFFSSFKLNFKAHTKIMSLETHRVCFRILNFKFFHDKIFNFSWNCLLNLQVCAENFNSFLSSNKEIFDRRLLSSDFFPQKFHLWKNCRENWKSNKWIIIWVRRSLTNAKNTAAKWGKNCSLFFVRT